MKNAIKRALLLFLTLCTAIFLISLPIYGAESTSIAVNTMATTARSRITRILLLGCDRTSGLTDSILLISIDEGARQVGILQIPRDTYAEYTERDYKKLNGAKAALGEVGLPDEY